MKDSSYQKTVIHVSGIPYYTVDARTKSGMPSLTNLVQEFLKRGWKVVFIYPAAEYLAPFVEDGINFYPVKSVFWGRKLAPSFLDRQKLRIAPFLAVIALFIRLCSLIKEHTPALLYAHTGIGVVASIIASKLYRIPLVARLYGFFNYKALINKKIDKFKGMTSIIFEALALAIKADLYVVTDDGTSGQQVVQEWGVADRSLVLRNGVDITRNFTEEQVHIFRSGLGLEPAQKMIIFVGRFEDWKRPDRILEVARCAKTQGLPWRFFLVGDGVLRPVLEHLVSQYQLQDVVKFVGPLPHDEIWLYLYCSDVFLTLHDLSSMSNTLLEALKIGVPVVCNNIGEGIEDWVKDSVNGRLVSTPDDPEQIILAIKNVLEISRVDAFAAAASQIWSWEERFDIEFARIDSLLL